MNQTSPKNYDLAIIGSGPGGYIAGLYASRKKLNVCVIEKDLLGGTCLNRGCIPTKAMLTSASLLSRIKGSGEFGIDVSSYKINFQKITSRRDDCVKKLRCGIETLFKGHKITLLKGAAKIVGRDTVSISGASDIRARHIIVAVGSKPSVLNNIPYDEKDILSSDGALSMDKLPESIAIIGGGVIGCEFAALFNALGVKVTMIEFLDRLIATQSREASKKLELIFKKRGIDIFLSARAESVEKEALLNIRLADGKSIKAQKVLMAVGRKPYTEDLGLDTIGIEKESGKISVNDKLQTNIENIYAIGDCVNGPLLAHKASYDGILACDNILGDERRVDYSNIPNCIWTDPEIASVGLSEDDARAKYGDAKTAKFPYLASGKAFIMGRPEGFIKITGSSKGEILGIEIMGENACDLIGEATLARTAGVNIKDLGRVVHGHPTLSEIFQEAAHIFCGTGIHTI